MSLVEIVAGTGGIIGQDIDATIKQELHAHTIELGFPMVDLVRQKTPVLTGALSGDLMFEEVTDVSSDDLLYVYAEGSGQIDQWGRLYVQYVEGPPLGDTTWTNPPRHIFLDTAEGDGRDMVEIWAQTWISVALGLCAAGLGTPLP